MGVHSKDCSILGSILGSPYFGKLPNCLALEVRTKVRSEQLEVGQWVAQVRVGECMDESESWSWNLAEGTEG